MGDSDEENHNQYMGEFDHFDNGMDHNDFLDHHSETEELGKDEKESVVKSDDHENTIHSKRVHSTEDEQNEDKPVTNEHFEVLKDEFEDFEDHHFDGDPFEYYNNENHHGMNHHDMNHHDMDHHDIDHDRSFDSHHMKKIDNAALYIQNDKTYVIESGDKPNSFSDIVNNSDKLNNSQEVNEKDELKIVKEINDNQSILDEFQIETNILSLNENTPIGEVESKILIMNNVSNHIDVISPTHSNYSENKKINDFDTQNLAFGLQSFPVDQIKEYDLTKNQQSEHYIDQTNDKASLISPRNIDMGVLEIDQNLSIPFTKEVEENLMKENSLNNNVVDDDEKFYEEFSHKYLTEFMEQIIENYLGHKNLPVNENYKIIKILVLDDYDAILCKVNRVFQRH